MIEATINYNPTLDELTATIELNKYGTAKYLVGIGVIRISNDGTGDHTRGNYDVTLYKRGSKGVWRTGKIRDFPRKSLGPYDLIYRALKIIVGDRND
jgi:hypothetical protein